MIASIYVSGPLYESPPPVVNAALLKAVINLLQRPAAGNRAFLIAYVQPYARFLRPPALVDVRRDGIAHTSSRNILENLRPVMGTGKRKRGEGRGGGG